VIHHPVEGEEEDHGLTLVGEICAVCGDSEIDVSPDVDIEDGRGRWLEGRRDGRHGAGEWEVRELGGKSVEIQIVRGGWCGRITGHGGARLVGGLGIGV
jgi:hypothetical protein